MGKLSFKEKYYCFRAMNDTESKLAEIAGLIFDAHTLEWKTRKIGKASALRAFADVSAERKFKNKFLTRFKRPENLNYPDDLTPQLHQIESAFHCLTRTPAYCADEAGLGKTIMATLCMNTIKGRVLIVCPPFLKFNWKIEIEKWSNLVVGIITEPNYWELSHVTIVPDSMLTNSKIQNILKSMQFTWMFVDEAHRFKDEGAQRTKVLTGFYAQLSRRTVFLSGTPIPNKGMELFPLINSFAPWVIGNQTKSQFGRRFCNAREITIRTRGGQSVTRWDYSGLSNLTTLKRWLFEDFMVRHLKKDVLTSLAPKIRQFIYAENTKKVVNYEQKLLRRYTIEDIMGLEEGEYDLGQIASYRRAAGISMITPAKEIIRDFLDSNPDECMVVAAHHVEVVETLFKELQEFNPLTIRGGMSARAKQDTVGYFQMDKRHRLLIGNIDSMGVGVTLTRAKRGLMVEPSWTPGVNEQMEDRLHRITQEGQVLWQYLLGHKSLNERILWRILEKQKGIDTVMS